MRIRGLMSSLPEKRKRSPSPSPYPSTAGKSPRGFLRKRYPQTHHRKYDKISGAVSGDLRMNFALKVAKRFLEVEPTAGGPYQNVACSPVSIFAVLCILAAGSDGPTREQLLGVLERDSVEEVSDVVSRLAAVLKEDDDEDAPDIALANALLVDHRWNLKKDFQKLLRDVYKTEATTVDFQNQVDDVVKEANLWVEKQSKGLFNQILSRNCITQDTTMILANVLYFKGVWVAKFKRKNTVDGDFHLLNSEKVRVPFMKMKGTYFDYGTIEGCQIIRMLYREGEKGEAMEGKNPSFSMYIFLPEKKSGLPDLIERIKLDENLFKDQIKLKFVSINKLHVPKFNFESDISLSEPMKHLGLTLPFDMARCELTKMVDSLENDDQSPFVGEIHHKCRIETSEKGTKAAAMVRVQLATMAAPKLEPINFVADHPFMFMIREDFSGAILFVGTILDPLSN